MRYTKFQGYRPFGSGEEEDFFKVFTIYGHVGPVVSEEKMFENVDIHIRQKPTYTISSAMSLNAHVS